MAFFYPEYDERKTLYWGLWIFILVYVIGAGIYLGFFVHNINFLHTWFANPSAPGDMLVSFRGGFTSASVRISVFSHVLSIFFIMTMLSFRKIYGCNIIWFILYIVCFGLSLVTLAGLSGAYANCNRQNQFGNVCNDRLYCCPTEIYTNPANRCPNTLPCNPPVQVGDLKPNSDFLGLYWMHFILLVFQGGFIGLIIWVLQRGNRKPEEEPEEEPMPEKKLEYPPPLATGNKILKKSKASHGLRLRN